MLQILRIFPGIGWGRIKPKVGASERLYEARHRTYLSIGAVYGMYVLMIRCVH